MLSRRLVLSGLAATPLFASGQIFATTSEDSELARAPNELGFADFAGAWDVQSGSVTSLVADAPDILPGQSEKYAATKLTSASEIADIVNKRTNQTFITWFNSNVAGTGPWKNKRINGSRAEANFTAFWDQFLAIRPLTFLEVVTYMCRNRRDGLAFQRRSIRLEVGQRLRRTAIGIKDGDVSHDGQTDR